VERAYLILDQTSASLSALAAHNPLHVTSIELGGALDEADYDSAASFGNVDALDVFDENTVRLHVIDVTNSVQRDLLRGNLTELRLAFEHERDGTIAPGLVGIGAGESSTPPLLWIDYTHAR
jgi:hypothetical protein